MKSIDELPLENSVFELRYNPAYLLWDRVGSIWSAMIAANPVLKSAAIQATQQVFETDTLQLSLETSTMRVFGRGPDALDQIVKNASLLTEIVCERIKLDSFTRAGFRMIRVKAFDSPKEAADFAGLPNDNTAVLDGKNRRIGCVKSARHESENAGIQTALRVEERELSFKVPWESLPFLPSNLTRKETVVVLDSDYYTIGIVERESLDIDTWVRQAAKAIHSHWSSI